MTHRTIFIYVHMHISRHIVLTNVRCIEIELYKHLVSELSTSRNLISRRQNLLYPATYLINSLVHLYKMIEQHMTHSERTFWRGHMIMTPVSSHCYSLHGPSRVFLNFAEQLRCSVSKCHWHKIKQKKKKIKLIK